MRVKRYNPELHFGDLESLYMSRGLNPMEAMWAPKIGYISKHAACFLRMVEGGYAQLDSLVSNSESSQKERHDFIDLVVKLSIKKARKLKLKGLVCTTQDEGTIKRAISRHGFVQRPEVVIVLPLGEH